MATANHHQVTLDFWLNWGRLYKMNKEKWEFTTEIVLSVFVLTLGITQGGNPEIYAAIIGVLHSFNIPKAIKAYKQAQVEKRYEQSKLE